MADTGSVLLTWIPASAFEGIHHYRVYKNNVLSMNTVNNSAYFDNLEYGIDFYFYVVGVTNDGRITCMSNTQMIRFPNADKYNVNLNLTLNTYL